MSMRDRIARAVLAGKVGGPTPTGIHVYHSSPHDFDRFDLGKIGTGEGAQSYGHGIYAAENPAVSGQGGQYWNSFIGRRSPVETEAADTLRSAEFDRERAIEGAKLRLNEIAAKSLREGGWDRMKERQLEALRLLESGAPVGPRTYEVNFKAQPEQLLDWDKPLAQMSPEVQKRLNDAWLAHPDDHARMTGEGIYGSLEAKNWDSSKYRGAGKPYASQTLLDAGIPGIRYLDEGSRNIPQQRISLENDIAKSRAAGDQQLLNHYEGFLNRLPQPTHNYVAFDPSKLDIMAKYGVVGGVPLGASVAQENYGAQP